MAALRGAAQKGMCVYSVCCVYARVFFVGVVLVLSPRFSICGDICCCYVRSTFVQTKGALAEARATQMDL